MGFSVITYGSIEVEGNYQMNILMKGFSSKTKDKAKAKGKYYEDNPLTDEPSMQSKWLVLQGSNIENIVLRSANGHTRGL